ncbi:hypothetical protein RHMOL_Rhmol08G0259500 [Rhododendron molle]|uniref:Uncharacterized protein n=1 Tax=Rhododendron molle TaxID=49168 RepID=A0ACC0MTT1_RHOML|nr:hypothetical protein RHMOL_Rhmol08G0259500 [Rhododendron molle]
MESKPGHPEFETFGILLRQDRKREISCESSNPNVDDLFLTGPERLKMPRIKWKDIRFLANEYGYREPQYLKYEKISVNKMEMSVKMAERNGEDTGQLQRQLHDVKALAKVRDWLVAGKIIRYKLGSSRGWDLRGLQEMANSLNIELLPVDENDPVRHRAVMQNDWKGKVLKDDTKLGRLLFLNR